jgi:diguanylate cyclase
MAVGIAGIGMERGSEMDDIGKLFSTFVDAVALILALVLVVSILHRKFGKPWLHVVLMGGMFSFALGVRMSDPIQLGPGKIFDMRGLMIGTAVALLGPAAGLITLTTGLAYRFSIGGAGVWVGTSGMVLAFAGGLAWRYLFLGRPGKMWKHSFILGVMISIQALSFFINGMSPLDRLVPLMSYLLVTNILGSLLLTYLLRGELSFLSEAEASKIEANTDHLTGLLNRRGLDMIYPKLAHHSSTNRGWALLCFDIDHFKQINDSHGHAVGDDVLKYVTEKVGSNLRPNDLFARLCGDEFAIVLCNIDRYEAKRIAQRCRILVAESGVELAGRTVKACISIGAIRMLDHSDIDLILDEADKALYAAKSGGRNKVVFKARSDAPAALGALQFAM